MLDAAAVGMPDAYAGELPVAFITAKGGAAPEEAALIDWLRPRIEDPAAVPKRIGLREAMPLTPIGKIFKPTLRAEAIRWAVADAAGALGVAARTEVSETLETTVHAPAADAPRLREALAGMPIAHSVHPEG
ncbi:AMP-binding enzyme [Rhodovulum sp. DZ06]|uniref:AMP-binding enzyme n=1 Tax=Rhodovulum sp. DZ06 TaxID=3425126 RepID=UPI003D34067D